MNKIIGLALLVASTSVYAEAWSAKNEAGGDIVITDNKCYINGKYFNALNEGYTRNPSGEVLHGCWYYDNGTVHMVYENKHTYAYPVQLFTKMQTW